MLLGNEHKMSSKNKGVMKQGEKLEEFLAELDDVYSANDGMLPEWKDYFVDTITEDSNDSALALQALDVIVNNLACDADRPITDSLLTFHFPYIYYIGRKT